jgi:thiol-disulfide isomerase/thioredoxin
MKALVLFCLVLLFAQCSGKSGEVAEPSGDRRVEITGYIHNRDVYPDTKELRLQIPRLTGKSSLIATPIEKDGTFRFQFELSQPQDASMETFLEFLYLKPGGRLHIELDFKKLLHAKFSGGDLAKINEDFLKYINATGYRSGQIHIGTDCSLNCSVEEIRKQLDRDRQHFRDRRDAFLQTTHVDGEVAFLTGAMIEMDYYDALVHALWIKELHRGDPLNPEALLEEINEKIAGYFSRGWSSNVHLKFVASDYLPLMYRIYNRKQEKEIPFFDWVKTKACNDTVGNFMMAVAASNALEGKNLDLFEQLYQQVDMTCLSDRLMDEYQVTLNKMKAPEAVSAAITGKPRDISSAIATTENLMAATITPNKGKVHVIDIWGTWCRPCVEGLAEYRKLADEYAGKDVTFSFLSVGSDENKCNRVLAANGLSLFPNHVCTEEERIFLSGTFTPIAYPYGILVNRKGIIVDYGVHVRPEGLREKIDLLLTQDYLIQ